MLRKLSPILATIIVSMNWCSFVNADIEYLTTSRTLNVSVWNSCDSQAGGAFTIANGVPDSYTVFLADDEPTCVGSAYASATQLSRILPNYIDGNGSASVTTTGAATAAANTTVDATFRLLESMDYILSGSVEGMATVSLTGSGTNAELGQSYSATSGVLSPGIYTLAADASVTENSDSTVTDAFDFTFEVTVPEPSHLHGTICMICWFSCRSRLRRTRNR